MKYLLGIIIIAATFVYMSGMEDKGPAKTQGAPSVDYAQLEADLVENAERIKGLREQITGLRLRASEMSEQMGKVGHRSASSSRLKKDQQRIVASIQAASDELSDELRKRNMLEHRKENAIKARLAASGNELR